MAGPGGPLRRRAFLATAALSAAAGALRVQMLPRDLSDAEVEALAAASEASLPPPPLPTATPTVPSVTEVAAAAGTPPQLAPTSAPTAPLPAPTSSEADYDVRGSMGALNPFAQRLEDTPLQIRYRATFKINTVERNPQRDLADRVRWSILVDGLVERPLEISADDFLRFPPFRQVADFHCVEGWGVRDVRWEGVRLADVLDRAGALPEARFVTLHTFGGVYTDSLTMEQARRPETMLATRLNGSPLADRQGYPNRLVVPFFYGYKSVKWVSRITLEARRHIGFWERRGWQLDPYV